MYEPKKQRISTSVTLIMSFGPVHAHTNVRRNKNNNNTKQIKQQSKTWTIKTKTENDNQKHKKIIKWNTKKQKYSNNMFCFAMLWPATQKNNEKQKTQ